MVLCTQLLRSQDKDLLLRKTPEIGQRAAFISEITDMLYSVLWKSMELQTVGLWLDRVRISLRESVFHQAKLASTTPNNHSASKSWFIYLEC